MLRTCRWRRYLSFLPSGPILLLPQARHGNYSILLSDINYRQEWFCTPSEEEYIVSRATLRTYHAVGIGSELPHPQKKESCGQALVSGNLSVIWYVVIY